MTREAATAPRVYQASDLNSKYRQVLNDAKADGIARVRDTDGTSLVVLPEEAVGRQANLLNRLEGIVEVVRAYIKLRFALDRNGLDEWRRNSPWPWVEAFDHEDLVEFASELGIALDLAVRLEDDRGLRECLEDWRTTADAVSDVETRNALLGAASPDDFVEVDRPAEAVAATNA